MSDWQTALREGATQLGIKLTAEQEALFARFLDLLLEKNAVMNLTAITDPLEVAMKHFLDSLTAELVWKPRRGDRVVDIGTGAGFPGIPLAIRHPDVSMVLNDTARKKADFLRDTVGTLQLENVHVVWARAEEMGRQEEFRAHFNVAFVRAVAHLGVLVEYTMPLLKVGGMLIAMKGPSSVHEVADSRRVFDELGAALVDVKHLDLPIAGERLLIQVRKVKPTPEKYPRDPGLAKKRPLFLDSTKHTP
ncbi:MAG: 16S rRNA (guanine(527)-N(7))-methyltransferase RsmG [Armatimonadota bacterium]